MDGTAGQVFFKKKQSEKKIYVLWKEKSRRKITHQARRHRSKLNSCSYWVGTVRKARLELITTGPSADPGTLHPQVRKQIPSSKREQARKLL